MSTSVHVQALRKEEMFTKRNFFKYFYPTILLTSPPLHKLGSRHFQLLLPPTVMQYFHDCHTLISLCRMFFPPSSTVDICCACFFVFLFCGGFLAFFPPAQHLFLSENKRQFAFGTQCLPLFIRVAQMWLIQASTYMPPKC